MNLIQMKPSSIQIFYKKSENPFIPESKDIARDTEFLGIFIVDKHLLLDYERTKLLLLPLHTSKLPLESAVSIRKLQII